MAPSNGSVRREYDRLKSLILMRPHMNKCKRQELLAESNRRTLQSSQWNCVAAKRPGRLRWLLAKMHTSDLTNTRWAACLAAACLLALSGCTAVKVKLGMRINLEKTPVTSMQASLY